MALGKKIHWPAWQLECEELGDDDMSAETSSSPGGGAKAAGLSERGVMLVGSLSRAVEL